nr:translation initiation factor IF-2-like [Aegilops tauschii subsp. strangulata]
MRPCFAPLAAVLERPCSAPLPAPAPPGSPLSGSSRRFVSRSRSWSGGALRAVVEGRRWCRSREPPPPRAAIAGARPPPSATTPLPPQHPQSAPAVNLELPAASLAANALPRRGHASCGRGGGTQAWAGDASYAQAGCGRTRAAGDASYAQAGCGRTRAAGDASYAQAGCGGRGRSRRTGARQEAGATAGVADAGTAVAAGNGRGGRGLTRERASATAGHGRGRDGGRPWQDAGAMPGAAGARSLCRRAAQGGGPSGV